MRFELLNALRDLDNKTPNYFLSEMFSHGSLKLKIEALEALRDLDSERGRSAPPKLKGMLRLV